MEEVELSVFSLSLEYLVTNIKMQLQTYEHESLMRFFPILCVKYYYCFFNYISVPAADCNL